MSIYSSSSISIHCRQVDALHSFLLYYNWSLDWVTVTFFYTVGVVYRRSPSSVHVPRYQIVVLVLVQLLILGISPSLDLEQGLNLELSWVLWINTQLRSNIPNIPNKKKKKQDLPSPTNTKEQVDLAVQRSRPEIGGRWGYRNPEYRDRWEGMRGDGRMGVGYCTSLWAGY
jgi:hypothetical protein